MSRRDARMSRGRYASSGAPFTPANLSGLVLWLRADLGITVDGSSNVQTWNDLSGNANNFTQGNAAQRPAYNTNPLNGKATATFSGGSNDNLLCANYLLDASPRSFAAVVRPTNVGSGTQQIYSSDATFRLDDGTGKWQQYNCTSVALTNNTAYALISVSHSSSNTDQYTNGSAQTGLTGYNNAGRGSTRVGADASGSVQGITGDLGELIIVNRDLSAGEVAKLRAYFTAYWGFSA